MRPEENELSVNAEAPSVPCDACSHRESCPQPAELRNGQGEGKVDKDRIAKKLAVVGIGGNIALSAFKLVAGLVGNSTAMVSDAIHSLSDVAATAVAYVGVRIAAKDPDGTHPYGHERFECLASVVLGVILACAGAGIGYAGLAMIWSYANGAGEIVELTPLPVIAAAVSIFCKEAMARYTLHWADIAKSAAFRADAKHHRSDALSSIGALVGIGASLLGFPLGDPIASVVIALLILHMAYEVIREAIDKMVDVACGPDTVEALANCISEAPGVVRLDVLRSRKFGARVFVDAEIAVDSALTIVEAHDIAEQVHDRIEQCFPDVKHIMIHVNPA